MGTQDHTETNPSSGLEGHHEVHLCHRCGWPFPNPHPSSRQRRSHKKICGTIEGYTLEQSHHSTVSDDENHSDDDDHKTPSPKIEEKKRSTSEFGTGGIGERSGRSEDEVFSDAVTEFSESGISPEGEEKLVAVRDSDKNVDKAVEGDLDSSSELKIAAISGATEPVNNLPIESSKVDVVVVESSEREAKDVKKIEKDGVDNVIPDAGERAEDRGCESSDSEIKLSEAKVVESLDIEVKDVKKIENDEVDNVISDAGEPVKDTICESSDPDIKLHEAKLQDAVRDISDSLSIEAKDREPTKGTVCESSDSEIKLQETKLQDRDGDISDSLGITSDTPSVQVQSDLSHGTESVVFVPATSTTVQTKADCDHGVDGHDNGDMSEVSDTKGQVDEAVRSLSISDLPVVDHSDILLEGNQEDNEGVNSEIPVILESAEIIMAVEDGNKDTKTEINSSAYVDPVAEEKEVEKVQGNTSANCLQSGSSENASSLDTISSHAQTDLSGASPMVTFVQEEVNSSTKLSGDSIADDCQIEKFIPDRDESNDGVAEKQNSEVSKSILEPIERLIENEEQDSIIQEESDVGNQEKLGQEHSSESPVERTETVSTDNCAGNTNEKKEPKEVSTEIGTDANELGNVIQKQPNSQEDQHEDPKEVVKEDQIDDIVSDMASENVIKKEPEQLPKDMETSSTVEDSHKGDSVVVSKPVVEEGNDKMINQQHGIDTSVHSSSQNSVEGNWGSVSVVSALSDAHASLDAETLALTGISKDNIRTVPDEHNLDKPVHVEKPSFMTFIDSADKKAGPMDIEVKAEASRAVKNEEVIAKVTNWSTEKPNALKTLLGEATAESKVKASTVVTQKDEAGAAEDKAVLGTGEKPTLPPEAPANNGAEKVWSPAKYPASDGKKERKKIKGRPWVPFVCCSSVNVN